MENFIFPDEIVLKILGYLGLGELIQCSKVSRRFNTICKDKSLSYRSSLLILKDLKVEDQKYFNSLLIARPEVKKVVVHSVRWEKGEERRLSEAMAKKKFLGPKMYRMKKKQQVLKAQGASPSVMHSRIVSKNTIEIGLYYFMPTKLSTLRGE